MGARAGCSDCHTPPLFTDAGFHNVGLYLNYADSGRARITYLPGDNGKFPYPDTAQRGINSTLHA
jgi:cytochrome c peroxidase